MDHPKFDLFLYILLTEGDCYSLVITIFMAVNIKKPILVKYP